ncbi:MAG TPA: hypothetical protein PK586_05450 [Casimicrobium sp.]|nr:hypothetical protein [Casimicrobium sp.]
MDAKLQHHVEVCIRRTTQSLRSIGLICGAIFAIVFLFAVYAVLMSPELERGMVVGLLVIATFVGASYALHAHSDRVQKRLRHVFYVAPEKVVKIEAKVIQRGPVVGYMFHLHSPKPTKMVGISVPNQPMFDALRASLPMHFANATYH